MPVMNGLDFIEEVRKENKEIPCIVMSAHTENSFVEQAERIGVNEYTIKPFDFIKFINLVDSYFEDRE